MELLYLWIEDHNCIKQQGFNFSPRYKFTFTPHPYENSIKGELIKEDLPSSTDDNFFGDHISNITAIVGKNGTGKSSLLDIIISFKESDNQISYIFVYIKNKSEFFIHTNIKVDAKFSLKEKKV